MDYFDLDGLTEMTRLDTLILIRQESESEMSLTDFHRIGDIDEKT